MNESIEARTHHLIPEIRKLDVLLSQVTIAALCSGKVLLGKGNHESRLELGEELAWVVLVPRRIR